MEPLYVGIAIAALLIIVVVLLISREKGKQRRKPSNLAMLAIICVVLGIIFGNTESILGYSFIGVGVLLSIIDIIRDVKSK